jgi:hypothetical protein
MAEETTPKAEAKQPAAVAQKPAAAKKPKAPALEDKPFPEFIEQDFLPVLKEALAKQGIESVELTFVTEKLPLGAGSAGETYPQVVGKWQGGKRQFNLYFLDGNIAGKKAFSCSSSGLPPSTLESFMIDERKVTLDLLLLYTLQRLNGQKWLARN